MVIDIIFVIALLWGFYLGFSKGIIKTLFTVLSIVLGMLAAFKFAPATTNFLETALKNTNPLMFLAGFICTFVLTMFLIRMFARGLEGIFRAANINFINQTVGGVALAGVMVLLYSMLIWFGDQAHILNPEVKAESISYIHLKEYPEQVRGLAKVVKPTFQEFWTQSVEMFDKLEQMSHEDSSVNADADARIYDIE